jgi:glycerate 2-kinase
MMKIKNYDRLVSGGDVESRKVVLEILEASLQRLDSYLLIRRLLQLEGTVLRIGGYRWDLHKRGRIFVVGAGKACNAMARAVEERLGDWISGGLVIVKQIEALDDPGRIELVEGGHPIPNEEGFRATRRILKMAEEAGPGDLFIGLISGGSSALMNCPVQGITLEEEMKVTEELLRSGARILEINAVRRHISATNGGRLAQKIEVKGAEMINLIISDSVGKKPTVDPTEPALFYGTPVAPDGTSLEGARKVLEKYDLCLRIPPSIVQYLYRNDPAGETPKSFSDLIQHFVIARPADACEAAKQAAEKRGLPGVVLTTLLEGESREAGTFLAAVTKEIALNHRPFFPPGVLIAGGETTTKIDGKPGIGGPSQELALGFSLEVAGRKGFCIGAIDTDGTDGPTEVAGGLGDGSTVDRARKRGMDVYESLKRHDSSILLKALGDEILTGNTGTNVCDLNVIYIGADS